MVTLSLTSSAFRAGETIPPAHTGDGKDSSPPLQWEAPPPGTKSLALVCHDPDAPRGDWVHWVIYNLPPLQGSLQEGEVPQGAVQGLNDFRKARYNGPAPPPGKAHRYFFRLYALDTALSLPAGTTRASLLQALEGHLLAQGELMGRYQRK